MRRIHIEGEDLERFAELLLRTMFNDEVLDEIEDSQKAQTGMKKAVAIVLRLCMIRGVREFLVDMNKVEDFPTVFEGWNSAAMEYLGDIAEAVMKACSEEGYEPSRNELELRDFFVAKGIDEDFLEEVNAFHQREEERLLSSLMRNEDDDSHECEGCEHCAPVELQNEDETWYFVLCPEHGRSALTKDQYTEQLLDPDRGFRCPKCDAPAQLERELDNDESS